MIGSMTSRWDVTIRNKNQEEKESIMAEITSAEKNGHIRHIVKVQPGEKIMLCRCYQSATFPLCDISHAKCQGEVGPVIIEAAQEGQEEGKA
jgi:CDGSH-type Zn-finger protein